MARPRYRATTGSSTSRQPCALWTLPGRRAFQVAVLVEHKERMVAGALEVAVVRGAFLRAVRRAHAAVDVQHQRRSPPPGLHAVDPVPGEIGQGRQVRRRGHRARLEAAHLACGRGVLRPRAPADNPAHRRIAPEAVGIVHVLVAGEAPEHRLTKLGDQAVAPVPPGAGQELRGAHVWSVLRAPDPHLDKIPRRLRAAIVGMLLLRLVPDPHHGLYRDVEQIARSRPSGRTDSEGEESTTRRTSKGHVNVRAPEPRYVHALSADALPGKPLPVALRAAKGAERSGSIMRYGRNRSRQLSCLPGLTMSLVGPHVIVARRSTPSQLQG